MIFLKMFFLRYRKIYDQEINNSQNVANNII